MEGTKAVLTRTFSKGDIIVYNVAFNTYPTPISLPMVISGSVDETRFAGEYHQVGGLITGATNCDVPERKGTVEGSIDLAAGSIRLTYDHTTLQFEAEFASIFSDKLVCRLTDKKLAQAFVLELTPARPATSQTK